MNPAQSATDLARTLSDLPSTLLTVGMLVAVGFILLQCTGEQLARRLR